MNKYDFRVLYSKLQTGALLVPWLIAYYGGKWLTALAHGIINLNRRTRKWANPDIHGKAPKRCRSLFYTRRRVERLVEHIEAQDQIIKRMSGDRDERIP